MSILNRYVMHMVVFTAFLFLSLTIAQPYCGTVHINNGGYQYAPVLDSENGTAFGCFNESIMSTGWNTLWIETNSRFTDDQQVYSAGFLEGVLTQKWIFDYLEDNVIFLLDTAISCELGDIPGICGNSLSERISHLKNYAKIPRDVRMKNWREKSQKKGDIIDFMIGYFEKNKEWMNQQIQSNPNDAYWQNVELILQQYQGLQDGYNSVAPLLEQFFDWEFNLLHFEEDLPDLVSAGTSSLFKEISGMFKYSRVPRGEALVLSHLDTLRCSSLVKYVGSDIFFAHDTWSYFLSMVRIFKQYNFPLHNPSVVSHKVSFSSYPGTLVSTDDFYLLDSGLAVTETTNNIYNMSLYQYVTPSTLLCPIRTILANRMSSSGSDWVHTFSKYNSGTYNNQWIILDYNLFKPNSTQVPGLLHILEQVPGFVVWEDVTDYINNQGFWPSYNIPYFPFIFNISGYPEMVKQEGEQNSYSECARAQIFKRDQSKVNSLNTMKFMMRENDYKHDPLSLGDPGNAISSRFDLEPSGNNSFPFGGLDSKITSYEMFSNELSCIAISGPTYQSVPPFSWDNWSFIPHPGQPDSWQFDWIFISNFKEIKNV